MIHSIALVFSTYPPESVWGTGGSNLARRFSRQHRITLLPANAVTIRSQAHEPRFTRTRPTPLDVDYHRHAEATFLRHSIAYLLPARVTRSTTPRPPKRLGYCLARLASQGSIWAVLRRYGNINPLSIDYACRPRLRSRLTQGGLAWPWNPWSFGGQGSHLPYRYSCLHSHSPHLHHTITRWLHW